MKICFHIQWAILSTTISPVMLYSAILMSGHIKCNLHGLYLATILPCKEPIVVGTNHSISWGDSFDARILWGPRPSEIPAPKLPSDIMWFQPTPNSSWLYTTHMTFGEESYQWNRHHNMQYPAIQYPAILRYSWWQNRNGNQKYYQMNDCLCISYLASTFFVKLKLVKTMFTGMTGTERATANTL